MDQQNDAGMQEVNAIIEKLLAVRGTRSSPTMQVRTNKKEEEEEGFILSVVAVPGGPPVGRGRDREETLKVISLPPVLKTIRILLEGKERGGACRGKG